MFRSLFEGKCQRSVSNVLYGDSFTAVIISTMTMLKVGAQDSTSTRCALGTSSRVLRMLTESWDVIRYVFLLSAGLWTFILDVRGGGKPVFSSHGNS